MHRIHLEGPCVLQALLKLGDRKRPAFPSDAALRALKIPQGLKEASSLACHVPGQAGCERTQTSPPPHAQIPLTKTLCRLNRDTLYFNLTHHLCLIISKLNHLTIE